MQDSNEHVLDGVDRRLLDLLQSDAGQTNDALARRANVSPATSLRRVRRLEAAGYIARRVALLDPQRFSPLLLSISEVVLDRQGAEHLDAFERRVIAHRAVQQCYRVSPGPDFIVMAAVGDMPAWAAAAASLFTQDRQRSQREDLLQRAPRQVRPSHPDRVVKRGPSPRPSRAACCCVGLIRLL